MYWSGFTLLWVLINVAGFLVDRVLFRSTFIAPEIVRLIETWIGSDGWALRVSVILSTGILGLIDGLLLGMFQWIAIRRMIKGAYGWILATSLGFSLGLMTFWSLMLLLVPGNLPLGNDLDRAFVLGLLDGFITGIVLGFGQYLVLRRKIRKAQWWVLAVIIASMAAWIVRWFVSPGASFFTFGIIGGIVIAILGAFGDESGEESSMQTDEVGQPLTASQQEH
jgi:hypothetical protein